MNHAFLLATSFAVIATLPSVTAAAAAPVIVAELFTSQGCSSCPPADRLLTQLKASQPDLLALDFHVDYWDRLGWKDPFSSPFATQRQRQYAASLPDEVYTPQLVVDGSRAVVGSDMASVGDALAQARAERATSPVVALAVTRHGGRFTVALGAGPGSGDLLLIGFDSQRTTSVGRGENSGRTLTEVNIVRSLRDLGLWSGGAVQIEAAWPEGQSAAVLLQRIDGRIIAVATAQ